MPSLVLFLDDVILKWEDFNIVVVSSLLLNEHLTHYLTIKSIINTFSMFISFAKLKQNAGFSFILRNEHILMDKSKTYNQ